MKKNASLDETEIPLDDANEPNVLNLDMWSEARHLTSLHNLANSNRRTTSDTYRILVEFEKRKADKRRSGKGQALLHSKAK